MTWRASVKAKPLIPRERAEKDVDEAIADYLSENAGDAALGFIDALERAYAQISRARSSAARIWLFVDSSVALISI